MAIKVCDQAAELSIALNGNLALERFGAPTYEDEAPHSWCGQRG
ncbi:hypothetical protein [Hydrogenophaga sp. BPS33]|nr:hypothetical protein [Hydrogenophaga sp. BPS33]